MNDKPWFLVVCVLSLKHVGDFEVVFEGYVDLVTLAFVYQQPTGGHVNHCIGGVALRVEALKLEVGDVVGAKHAWEDAHGWGLVEVAGWGEFIAIDFTQICLNLFVWSIFLICKKFKTQIRLNLFASEQNADQGSLLRGMRRHAFSLIPSAGYK